MNNIVEICCGSYYDARQAALAGATRIELNSALFLGGLTPSVSALAEIKFHTNLEVICMVRPRGGGFHYNDEDYITMLLDTKLLLEQGADGIAFGFLQKDKNINKLRTKEMCDLIHSYGKTAVFHRAIDVCIDINQAVIDIVDCGCDRILTSGGKEKAISATNQLAQMQKEFGKKIEFIVGSGVNESNAHIFIKECNLNQIHSSCKGYIEDPSTSGEDVNFKYLNNNSFDVVDPTKVKDLLRKVENL